MVCSAYQIAHEPEGGELPGMVPLSEAVAELDPAPATPPTAGPNWGSAIPATNTIASSNAGSALPADTANGSALPGWMAPVPPIPRPRASRSTARAARPALRVLGSPRAQASGRERREHHGGGKASSGSGSGDDSSGSEPPGEPPPGGGSGGRDKHDHEPDEGDDGDALSLVLAPLRSWALDPRELPGSGRMPTAIEALCPICSAYGDSARSLVVVVDDGYVRPNCCWGCRPSEELADLLGLPGRIP